MPRKQHRAGFCYYMLNRRSRFSSSRTTITIKSGDQRAFRSVLIGILRTSALKNLRQSTHAYTVQIAEKQEIMFSVLHFGFQIVFYYMSGIHMHISTGHTMASGSPNQIKCGKEEEL